MPPLEAARRVKILFFGMLIMYGEGFFTTRDFYGYRDWPQSNAEVTRRRGRSTFPSFHGAAQRGAACNDKQYSLSFFKARRGVWRGRTFRPILYK